MKLQGASILDLVTELLIRLDAQGKTDVIDAAAPALRSILEECGHDALDCFIRMGVVPPNSKLEVKHAGDDRLQQVDRSKRGRR